MKRTTLHETVCGESIRIITRDVARAVPARADGAIVLFLRGSPGNAGALTLDENADPTVQSDLMAALKRIHSNSPACMAATVGCSLSIPVSGGSLMTGTWQGIYLCNFSRANADFEISTVFLPGTASSCHFDPPSRGCFSVKSLIGGCCGDGEGLCHVLVRHTSASVAVAVDGTIAAVLEQAASTVVPESWNRDLFEHTYEGDDDMPAHVKTAIIGASVAVPFGRRGVAPFLELLLCEHRDAGGWGGGGRKIAVARTCLGKPAVTKEVHTGPIRGWTSVGSVIAGALSCPEMTSAVVVSITVNSALASVVTSAPGSGDAMFNQLCSIAKGRNATAAATMLGQSLLLPVEGGALCIGDLDVFVLLSSLDKTLDDATLAVASFS